MFLKIRNVKFMAILAFPISSLFSCNPNPIEYLKNVDDLLVQNNIQSHLEYLASPELGGRTSGSLENQLACDYVASQFQEFGLSKYSQQTNYFQPYVQENTRVFTDYFSFRMSNIDNTESNIFRYSHDFSFFIDQLYPSYEYVASGSFFDGEGELVSYADSSTNYENKFVILGNLTSDVYHELLDEKAKGALILDYDDYPAIEYGQGEYLFGDSDFLLLNVKYDTYNQMLENISNGINQIDSSYTVDISSKTVNNVIGILDVGAPTSVIVSSHIDHLGRFDGEDDGYYAGALDNASGVASMLELARIYSSNKEHLKTNYIFIAYNGEEAGLYGSQYYSKHLVGERSTTAASFNLDMLGGGSDSYLLEIIGYIGSLRNRLVSKCAEYAISNYAIEGNDPNSDHYWLGKMSIPSLSFVHFDDRYYHTPNDTIDKINYDVLLNQLSMISSLMLFSYN